MKTAAIDFEASSLYGWPIESGWMREGDVAPRSMLIKPAPGWTMREWSEDAAQLHYISPADLERDGVDARQVVDAIATDLAGCVVISDAPALDQRWLDRLCAAAGMAAPLQIVGADVATLAALAKLPPSRHRAGLDAERLLHAWGLRA